ncbi:MAG: 3-dehydroquinate synthase family protein [Candidatus Limimorpha sp.]
MILYHSDIARFVELVSHYSKVFVLMDENSCSHCLPAFIEMTGVEDFVPVVIRSGESFKNLETVSSIWKCLVENYADRNALIINLGGGTVSDIGGFAASCYQRGIDFVNVPTSLLSMVDASVGGKTGIDFYGLKNQIGTFCNPVAVLVLPEFLGSLPYEQMLSGLGELAKYGFISTKITLEPTLPVDIGIIKKAVEYKMEITGLDAVEKGLRKVLNFGHTVGHALESYFSHSETALLHGEAVAIGIIPALLLSSRYCGLDTSILRSYCRYYHRLFKKIDLKGIDLDEMLGIMHHDKKNLGGKIRFVLLENIGMPVTDVVVADEDIKDSLCYLIDYMGDEDLER